MQPIKTETVQLTLESAKQIITPTITRIANLLSESDAASLAVWLADLLDIDPPFMVDGRPQVAEAAGDVDEMPIDYLA